MIPAVSDKPDSPAGGVNPKALAIMTAMAHMEGYFQAIRGEHTLAFRNNNPGNIRSWGELPAGEGGYCKPATKPDGFRILYEDILANSGKLTLREFIGKYAPPSDNNQTTAYLSFVSEYSGIGAGETF